MSSQTGYVLTAPRRTALITGASRGIGRGAALALARLGCDVAVNYRTGAKEAAEVVAEIEKLGRRAVAVQADVSDPEQVERMVDEVEAALGHIGVLVVNAAFSIRRPWVEAAWEEIEATLAPSLYGAIHVTRTVGKRMVERGGGTKVVFISSPHAEIPFPTSGAYNIGKAGMEHLGKTLATEWVHYRINVNIVQPGWTDTPGEHRLFGSEEIARQAPTLPWGRLATIEDIGHAVAFFCSDQAEYMTGAVLRVDGGLTLPVRPRATAK